MTKTLLRQLVVALIVLGTALAGAPAIASATQDHEVAQARQGKVKIHAKPSKLKVKAHESFHIGGNLEVNVPRGASGETIIVQSWQNNTWVNIAYGSCTPSWTFRVSLSLSFSATLRVFFPGTVNYSEAVSESWAIAVI